MPPLALAQLLHHALPSLSPQGRAVISSLICDNGRVGSAQRLCERLGLRTRFQLNRLLHREGLPPFEELSGWVCILFWMVRADAAGGAALRSLVAQTHMDAASGYRLVRRVTGRCWRELRRVGTAEVMRWFKRRATTPASSRRVDIRPQGRGLRSNDPPAVPAAAEARLPARLPLTGVPHGVAVSRRGFAYVTRVHAAALECLDLATGRFTASIPLGCAPTCAAVDPMGARCYVTVQYCDEVAVVDVTHHAQIHALRLAGDPFPVLLSPRAHTLFVTTNEDRLYAIATQTGRILGSLPLPATSHHLALNRAGNRLYVATRTAGSVLEVDTARCEVIRTFRLGGWPQAMTVSADGSMLYVANEKRGIDVVRLGSGSHVAGLEVGGATELLLGPDGQLLYASFVHEGTVRVLDVTSLKVLATLETGGRPREIALDRVNRSVIVANESGWVDLLPYGAHDIVFPQTLCSKTDGPVALSAS